MSPLVYIKRFGWRRSLLHFPKWLRRVFFTKPFVFCRKYIQCLLPFTARNLHLAEQKHGYDDFYIFGVIEWNFRYQRPQHLSTLISQFKHRVFYISSRFVSDMRAGFEIIPLDSEGRLFEVYLYVPSSPNIYELPPTEVQLSALRSSIGQVVRWANSRGVISFVQHAFWCDIASSIPNNKLVYDCIDWHEGFDNNGTGILELERRLFSKSDLVVTTSTWLNDYVLNHAKNTEIIRNACEYNLFSTEPTVQYKDPNNRKIIGYYGAIAGWFDIDLIALVAERFHDCCILLVGADTIGAKKKLDKYKNVVFVGEVRYIELPYYLWAFDVALLPFKVIPLTLATNPVKVYEYLSAGKQVVSVDLPEILEFGSLVKIGRSPEEFVKKIQDCLNIGGNSEQYEASRAFAQTQTWRHRCTQLLNKVRMGIVRPMVSVVIVTYNNIEYTQECLRSIEENSDYSNLQIVVVDNASTDGSVEYLRVWAQKGKNRICIYNDVNKGFSAANNQGMAISRGEYIILLNNDTYVTPGWIGSLLNHYKEHPLLGLLGPVTNNIGNEAKINISYANMEQMIAVSQQFTSLRIGHSFSIKTLAFFCVVIPKSLYEKVGDLSEEFGLGFFEDDDYCRRVERLGYEIRCAEDVFVHHQLSASFLKIDKDMRRELFERNKQIYEKKWGKWEPHQNKKRDKWFRL